MLWDKKVFNVKSKKNENIGLERKMKKKFLIPLVTILLLIVSLCGCFQNEENSTKLSSEEKRFLGSWANSTKFQGKTITITYNFSPNKTYEVTAESGSDKVSYSGTWKIRDDILFIAIEGRTQSGDYQFLDNDTTLILTDMNTGNNTILKKQLT